MSGEAAAVMGILSGLAAMVPPRRPFSEAEEEMVRVPLEETLYRYGMNVDPALSLAIALGMIAAARWAEVKMMREAEAAKPMGKPADA